MKNRAQFKSCVGMFCLLILTSVSTKAKTIDITMVGDIGFNKSNAAPHPDYVTAYGVNTSWPELTQHIAPLINGHINFGNIETVVSDVPLSLGMQKAYKFQSHPNSVVHMTNIGFNLFSLANNHMADYGYAGLQSTYQWMNAISSRSSVFHHGLGVAQEIIRPTVFRVNGITVAFMAIGIDGFGYNNFPATERQIGSLNKHHQAHRQAALATLRATKADFKILSVHTGTEGRVALDANQKEEFRSYVDQVGVDLVIGHHPHVVRAVEMYKGKLIAYSLGNFLLIGAANMDSNPLLQSYGLMLKAKVTRGKNGMVFQAVQAIPIRNMHHVPYPVTGPLRDQIIGNLNGLSRSSVGEGAILFN